MKKWWWLSVPYSIGYQVLTFAFVKPFWGHYYLSFAVGFYICLLAAASSGIWVLFSLYRLLFSDPKESNLRMPILLPLAVMASVPWILWM